MLLDFQLFVQGITISLGSIDNSPYINYYISASSPVSLQIKDMKLMLYLPRKSF